MMTMLSIDASHLRNAGQNSYHNEAFPRTTIYSASCLFSLSLSSSDCAPVTSSATHSPFNFS